MRFENRDDAALDAGLRDLGNEARVTHSRSHLDAVYAETVARLDAQTKAAKPGRVPVRASERDGGLLTDPRAEDTRDTSAHSAHAARVTIRILAGAAAAVITIIALVLTVVTWTGPGTSGVILSGLLTAPMAFLVTYRSVSRALGVLMGHLSSDDKPSQNRNGRWKQGS
ncbi:hypothetical protein [Actinoplanes subglobosus]|uniref:DUF1707 domain-containing protein n=1 Tax=Actinoplanes subglobosus TaxID=1547892 RepID=A0ABV8ISD2_9ACTN